MVATLILEQVLNGVLVGTYYLLIALGLSLIFSLSGVVNLAHGAFYAIGAYVAVTIRDVSGFWPSLLISPLVVAMLGLVTEKFIFRRFYREDPIISLLATFGLAMVIEQVLRMIYGSVPMQVSVPSELRGQLILGDLLFARYRLFMLTVAILALAGVWALLNKTPFGRIVKAGVQNPDMVAAMGISLSPILTALAGLSIGLAGMAGVLIAPIVGVHPAMGAEVITAAFVVVVIGGLGSFWGVVVAALLVGIVRGLTVYFYPVASEASIYILMVIVLLTRPRGLFGERIVRFE